MIADRRPRVRAKHQAMDMVVHAYDIFFYLSSWSTLTFLWSEYRAPLVDARRGARRRR